MRALVLCRDPFDASVNGVCFSEHKSEPILAAFGQNITLLSSEERLFWNFDPRIGQELAKTRRYLADCRI